MTNASDIAALVAALPDDAEVTIVRVTRGNNRGPGLASRRPQGVQFDLAPAPVVDIFSRRRAS